MLLQTDWHLRGKCAENASINWSCSQHCQILVEINGVMPKARFPESKSQQLVNKCVQCFSPKWNGCGWGASITEGVISWKGYTWDEVCGLTMSDRQLPFRRSFSWFSGSCLLNKFKSCVLVQNTFALKIDMNYLKLKKLDQR